MSARTWSVLSFVLVISVLFSLSISAREPRRTKSPDTPRKPVLNFETDGLMDEPVLKTTVDADTFVLGYWTFDSGGSADAQGWTSNDITAPMGCYFHVDDFAGLDGGDYGLLIPLEGGQSAWCGARPDHPSIPPCQYATLPGYGNAWFQGWCFKCIEVPDTEAVSIRYLVAWDTEPGFDYWHIEYATNSSCDSLLSVDDIPTDDWIEIVKVDDFGTKQFRADTIPAGHDGFIRIRYLVTSDGGWSDQDGLWNTDGAVIIDSITVESASAVYDFEDFEDESPGDLSTTDGDWECWVRSGYGDYAGLFSGGLLLQEDPCKTNISFMWAFIKGSTETYACGGFPDQIAVPQENERGQFICNEVVSPLIAITGTGSIYELSFDVYRDLTGIAGGYVWYNWAVRSWVGGCPGNWKNRDPVGYYGAQKDWYRPVQTIGDLVEPGATHIQISLQVEDWSGVFGYPNPCHSHSPLFDNVEVRRIAATSPLWSARDVNLFQDTFPTNGTGVGTGRIDIAYDSGDSARIMCWDPESGLLEPEPYTGFGSAVYCYASVYPQNQPGKSGSAIEADNFRWPVVDSVTIAGSKWYVIRMDTAFTGGSRTSWLVDAWVVDLNDNLLESGDTLCFFFGAENAVGGKSYWSRSVGITDDRDEAAAAPMEMQILPGGALSGNTDILFVNNFDGRGAQPYFDSAFEMMNIEPDRYDVRIGYNIEGNTLAGRVINVTQQLIPYYRKIIWNTGNLDPEHYVLIGDGDNGNPDDFALFNSFLSQHTHTWGAGIYISGDNVAEQWNSSSSASATAFRSTYMNHNLVSGSHRAPVEYGVSPLTIGEAGSKFEDAFGPDTMIAYGACPGINDFDVVQPAGSATLEMTYNSPGNPMAGAVIAQAGTNGLGNPVGVVLSGFSFHYIRDDRARGIPVRAEHLLRIIQWLGNIVDYPVGVVKVPQYTNSLSQNYPNPFNPNTKICYSIAEKGHVSLKIYNVAGQHIKTLVSEVKNPRRDGYIVTWDGKNENNTLVSSGVYFYRMVTEGFIQTKKMVFIQ